MVNELNVTNFSMVDLDSNVSACNINHTDPIASYQTKVIVQSLILLLTFCGNAIVVCILLHGSRHVKLTRVRFFILQLALADISVGIFATLSHLVLFEGNIDFPVASNLFCKLVKYTQMIPVYASAYILAMCAIDRFFAVVFPLHSRHFTSTTIRSLVGIAWIIGLIMALPQLIYFYYDGEMQRCWGNATPTEIFVYTNFLFVLGFLIPLIVLVVCYTSICVVVWNGLKFRSAHSHTSVSLGRMSHKHQSLKSSKDSTLNGSSVRNNNANSVIEMYSQPLDVVTEISEHSSATGKQIDLGECKHNQCEKESKAEISAEANNNASVYSALIKKSKNVTSSSEERNRSWKGRRYQLKASLKTIRVTLLVCVFYVVCSTPFYVVQLWWAYNPAANVCTFGIVVYLALVLNSLNSCCNPWIYGFCSLPSLFRRKSNRGLYGGTTTNLRQSTISSVRRISSMSTDTCKFRSISMASSTLQMELSSKIIKDNVQIEENSPNKRLFTTVL